MHLVGAGNYGSVMAQQRLQCRLQLAAVAVAVGSCCCCWLQLLLAAVAVGGSSGVQWCVHMCTCMCVHVAWGLQHFRRLTAYLNFTFTAYMGHTSGLEAVTALFQFADGSRWY
jgi:hypothetical protein